MEAFIIDWQAGENATKFKMMVHIQAFKVTFRLRIEFATFSMGIRLPSTRFWWIRNFLNPLSRVEIFEYAMNISKRACGRDFEIVIEDWDSTGFQYLSVELGFWIPIVSGIPDSGLQNRGFQISQAKIYRIPLTSRKFARSTALAAMAISNGYDMYTSLKKRL